MSDARAALDAALTITQHHGDGSNRAAAMMEALSLKWRLVPADAVPVDAERLRELEEALVAALRDAAEEEAAVWTSDKRPVVGTWGGRILAVLRRYGIEPVRLGDAATDADAKRLRDLLGYLWIAEGKRPGLAVRDLFNADDPLVCDVEAELGIASAPSEPQPTFHDLMCRENRHDPACPLAPAPSEPD